MFQSFFLFSLSRFAGRTHDSAYTLYRLGERLSSGVRLYVETGRTDGMDADGDSPSTLHSFTGPPVPQGEGTSVARAFLDGNHTLISIMARINPSPDWFVGLDSFQLCVEGNWVDTVTVEVIIHPGGRGEGSLISIFRNPEIASTYSISVTANARN